jgi:mono/diheme cytochrome c family protein
LRILTPLIVLILLFSAGLGLYVYSGSYPIGADIPHSGPVFSLLATVRDRSVAAQARRVRPPADLDRPQRLSVGAGQYAAMCSGCHLAPGYESGETWEGLYPQPPRLAHVTDLTPAEIFWVVKHGLKFSGMPAWGKSHSDDEIWDITAFVLKLPHLTAAQYKDIVTRAPADADMTMMPMPGGGSMP